MFEFKHPKYYKELRERNKSDQAISLKDSTVSASVRRIRAKASSFKLQAASLKLLKHQAASLDKKV
jgi:hypothetical protein